MPGAGCRHIYVTRGSSDPRRVAKLTKAHAGRDTFYWPACVPTFSLSIAFIIQLTFLFHSIASLEKKYTTGAFIKSFNRLWGTRILSCVTKYELFCSVLCTVTINTLKIKNVFWLHLNYNLAHNWFIETLSLKRIAKFYFWYLTTLICIFL